MKKLAGAILISIGIALFASVTPVSRYVRCYGSYLVQSGSMEPAIMTGDIIIVACRPAYGLRDVITFRGSDGRIITHRIVEKKDGTFATKGDANRVEDSAVVPAGAVIGKVILVIPKLGYLAGFAKTLPGFILLIVIPSLLLIGQQLF